MGVEGGVNARRQVVQPGAAHGDEVLERALVVVVQAAAQRTGTISSGAIPALLLPAQLPHLELSSTTTEHGSGNGRRYGSTQSVKFSRKQPVSWPRRALPRLWNIWVVFQPICDNAAVSAAPR